MAAASVRFAARKIFGRALDRPQAFFTTAASAAVKEELRRVRPRFGHGGGSLRRFTSSSSPNVPNDKHVGKSAPPSGPPSAPPSEPLPHDSTELIRNLHPDTLVRVPVSLGTWSLSNPRFLFNLFKLAVGMTAFCAAAVYLEIKYIDRRERQAASEEQEG